MTNDDTGLPTMAMPRDRAVAAVPAESPVTAAPALHDALSIELEYAPRVNVAMQQNGVPLVERVAISNDGAEPASDLTVTISLDNGECAPWTGRIDRIDPGDTYHLEPDRLHLDLRHLACRTEAERTHIRVEIGPFDPPHARTFPIEVLAFDQWPGSRIYPDLLAAFVTPNHPLVAELLIGARQSLSAMSDHDALDGYQANSRQRAAHIAEACFNSIAVRGIGYINPPASFDVSGQRVRLVDRLCREGMGSCLDLSLLLAGLWEQAGLHPLVLLLEGHAMPAVWTREAHLPEPAIDEPARIRNLIELGDIVPVESTMVTHSGARFADAVEAAKRRMIAPGAGFCAVDVRSGRKRGVGPLPLRADGESSGLDVDVLAAATPARADTPLARVALADRAEGATRGGAAAAVEPAETGPARIARWKTRLLDLSLRNRLINFRETGRTIRLAAPDVARLEDLLADKASFTINPKTDGDDAYLREQLEGRHVYTAEAPAEMQKRLLNLYRLARSSIAETGANLLYMALGQLKWFESGPSQVPRFAPLILLPAELRRRATGSGYVYDVRLSEEPLRPNVTLLEKLRTEFGIDTAGLDNLPEDERGLDVPLILRNFREAIRDTARWEVEESAHLGLFSFNKFLMWRDLQENLEGLQENRLVNHLVETPGETFDPAPFPQPEELDDTVPPGEMFCTRDADSSQLAAIRAAAQGRSFVLEGPPGTGKSQTIANIVADAIGHGRRVLFVAEKMAALSVVSNRLKEDGLGPFCLELHSAKASKKEVLRQLEEALEAGRTATPPDWSALCDELGITRNALNTYVRELHRPRASGESLYRVLGRMALLGDGPRVEPPAQDLPGVTSEQLARWRTRIEALREHAEAVDPPHEHPLRGIGRSAWDFTLPNQATAAIAAGASAIEQLAARASTYLTDMGLRDVTGADFSRDGVQTLAVAANQLLTCPSPHRRLLIGREAPALIADMRALIEQGRQRDAARAALLEQYRPEFFDLEHLIHLDRVTWALGLWAPFRLIAGWRIRGRLRPYCQGRVPELTTLRGDLERTHQVRQVSSTLAAATEAGQVFGRRWKDGEADWDELVRQLDWAAEFHKAAAMLRREPGGDNVVEALATVASDPERVKAIAGDARSLVKAFNEWQRAWKALKELLLTNAKEAFGEGLTKAWLGCAAGVLQRWAGALDELNDWCAWRRARDEAVEAGLDKLISAFETGSLVRADVRDAFERGFGEPWFNAVANTVDAVRRFNASGHAKTIERFRAIDRALIERTRYAVTSRIAETAPAGAAEVSGRSEMGILRRELEKKSRHLPTRRLIEAVPNLLPRLKPCFLMSPLSVAQYLDSRLPPFDLVVFDEASQIPVWDAIGAVARGAEVVVVGDSKQLPPTNFFNTLDGEDETEIENEDIDDMESILKECNASGVPALRLKWHYRSRHESLIAFSNHHYYNNSLHTFPSPEDRSETLGVTFRHVADGLYDRGGSRTNRVEAEAVVAEIVRRLQTGDEAGSIGVVTFNQSQQSLIEDLLDERRRALPEIEPFFTDEVREPVFVKNLENVQGDERDTIIFSVGYGPDQAGRHSMNFGPLNKEGGERRLNVAVTRARERLIVFSSMRSDDIDLTRTRALGVKHFKTFLDYADRGPRAIAEQVDHGPEREFDSGFERAVWKALTERGWKVDTQVGCAGYRVDLAVRDPDRPGRYLLGIECDGTAYHSAKTARDRDRLRQSVLEGLGWRIARIWSTDWWINAERCLGGVERIIEETKDGGATGPHDRSDNSAVPAQVQLPAEASAAPAPGPPQYRCAAPTRRDLQRLDIFDPAVTGAAAEALGAIVQGEGPIVDELALRRMARWFDVQRITERFRERYADVRHEALRTQPVTEAHGVLWPASVAPSTYGEVRVPGPDDDDVRDVELIPLIERINAVVHVLDRQVGLPREDLERETARLLGAPRLTARVQAAVAEAVDAAIDQGRAANEDGQVTLPRD